jgi:hypothetical protein
MTKAEAGRLGGRSRGGRKAIAALANARKARAVQLQRNGALFGKVNPAYLKARAHQERPRRDWSRFEQFRQAVMD